MSQRTSTRNNARRSASWVLEYRTLLIQDPADSLTIQDPDSTTTVTVQPPIYRGTYDDDIDR